MDCPAITMLMPSLSHVWSLRDANVPRSSSASQASEWQQEGASHLARGGGLPETAVSVVVIRKRNMP
ncbi:MAG: hypothetical protein BWY82_01911 [Verrucomicrobia bacterium ADurb.Bin474]|nr:MAG: hypothetical protein BWY82_01911 [Verrucomicrobia bacterium ADurb.Bin474]